MLEAVPKIAETCKVAFEFKPEDPFSFRWVADEESFCMRYPDAQKLLSSSLVSFKFFT